MSRLASIIFLSSLANCFAGDDMGDHPRFVHAMDVATRAVDGFPVVFQYGQVRPEFNHCKDSATRRRSPLDGPWRFIFDPDDQGRAAGWHKPGKPSGEWTTVTIPHCWDMMPGGDFTNWSDRTPANPPHYDGTAWYRKSFTFTKQPGKHQRIEFLGVQQRARIHLNGREIALHDGVGQPFSVDVTGILRNGGNLLAVQVIRPPNHEPFDPESKRGPAEIEQIHGPYPKAPDNWPYAGIIREVTLIEEGPVTARKVQLRTRNGMLDAAAIVTNHGDAQAAIDVRLATSACATSSASRPLTIAPGTARVVRFSLPLKPDARRWSPASPALHDFQLRLTRKNDAGRDVIDEWHGRFGIREFAIQDTRFMLNGEPVFLKGIAVYDETHDRGAALLPEDHHRIHQLCRDAGANFLRLQAGQRAPMTYQLADQLGFMVTAEWGGFWYREKAMAAQVEDPQSIFQSNARCTIWDLMNHPSVIIWCSHNESHQFCPEYEPFVATGTGIVRELDWQNRPVTWAAWHPLRGQPNYQHADAIGFNQYRGAHDRFEDLDPDLRRTSEENPGKPLLILENGAWARLGDRGANHQRGTEDWQADLMRRQHKVLSSRTPPLAGYTYWLIVDYRSRKFYTANPHNNGYSNMGLHAPNGQPKLVRDVFRDLKW